MSDAAGAIVIVGGGHAGAQLCAALAGAGHGARVHLVCAEEQLPYQRPPLSKSFLKNRDEPLQWHRDAAWFSAAGIMGCTRTAMPVSTSGSASPSATPGWPASASRP